MEQQKASVGRIVHLIQPGIYPGPIAAIVTRVDYEAGSEQVVSLTAFPPDLAPMMMNGVSNNPQLSCRWEWPART